jgi:hypothetical protein
MDMPNREFVLAGSLEELKAKGRLVLHRGHRAPFYFLRLTPLAVTTRTSRTIVFFAANARSHSASLMTLRSVRSAA